MRKFLASTKEDIFSFLMPEVPMDVVEEENMSSPDLSSCDNNFLLLPPEVPMDVVDVPPLSLSDLAQSYSSLDFRREGEHIFVVFPDEVSSPTSSSKHTDGESPESTPDDIFVGFSDEVSNSNKSLKNIFKDTAWESIIATPEAITEFETYFHPNSENKKSSSKIYHKLISPIIKEDERGQLTPRAEHYFQAEFRGQQLPHNMTISDMACLRAYTGRMYGLVNKLLRGGYDDVLNSFDGIRSNSPAILEDRHKDNLRDLLFFTYMMASGYNKFEQSQPKNDVTKVYRYLMTSKLAERLETYKEGCIVSEEAFTSTTTKDYAPKGWERAQIKLVYNNATLIDLEAWADCDGEKEYLLRPGQQFTVTNVTKTQINAPYMWGKKQDLYVVELDKVDNH